MNQKFMKKVSGIFMAVLLIVTLTACGQKQQEETASTDRTDRKILIAYFSWSTSGNTEKVATYIQKQTGGDLLKLEPVTPYPTDYNETGDIAKAERDENARPEIADLPESISEYDTIFVGYPKMEYSL